MTRKIFPKTLVQDLFLHKVAESLVFLSGYSDWKVTGQEPCHGYFLGSLLSFSEQLFFAADFSD